jgi:hypothetical protein
MYAILYLPEALWVRDIRANVFSDDVATFVSEAEAEIYIQDYVLPYTKEYSDHKVIREYMEIFPVHWI